MIRGAELAGSDGVESGGWGDLGCPEPVCESSSVCGIAAGGTSSSRSIGEGYGVCEDRSVSRLLRGPLSEWRVFRAEQASVFGTAF